jgi:hypothetical protein
MRQQGEKVLKLTSRTTSFWKDGGISCCHTSNVLSHHQHKAFVKFCQRGKLGDIAANA